ncbi:hypothetical protein [Limnofasciculus baicalensis]|uniref:Uncharacterized protein n=1 Tax=Limnofasciculus baicalensis BBK-W-15 TaxID=2699891 RepID=A0AAE3GNX1_9CYAN|nr:hypothetical protein [Limnofasciculus baicalensis]MCP2727311.1 hypothetical protein [Limnofasciculus baicalensis BBK-W-15]
MSDTFTLKKQNPGQLNSVQLNIVTVIDLHKAVKDRTTKDAIYMMDNSVGGTGQGTGHLQTVCKPGQVLNWIIYPMDMEKRPDGTWPPMPKINNIVFLDSQQEGDTEEFSETKVCTELKVYGGPDMMRSPYCPVYYYWAGAVLSTLPTGVYNYRFVLELEQECKKEKVYLNTFEKPSLKVVGI